MCKTETNLKSRYPNEFEKIRLAVNGFDPCGFIHLGAPIDEYDCLTENIMKLILARKSKDQIRVMILDEIENHFGTPDLELLYEPYKSEFFSDLDKLVNSLDLNI